VAGYTRVSAQAGVESARLTVDMGADEHLPRLRLTTGEMAYGPHAVARYDGKVIFVRGAAPNEEVDVVLREDRRSYAFADTVAVVQPSAERRSPPCAYLPACGGCPWQHVSYAAQLAAKRRIVREQLRRIAGLEVDVEPVLPSPQEFGYRRRIKLRADAGQLGYYAAASHDLVPVAQCLLAEPAAAGAIEAATALAGALHVRLRRIELIGRAATGAEVVIAAEIEGAWDARDEPTCRDWLAGRSAVRGLVLRGRGWQRQWGDTLVEIEPESGLVLQAHAPTFTQVNPAANRLLVATVMRYADPQPGERVLDLYAGVGNFSFPLRRRGAAVTAVEQDRQAAADAIANQGRHPDLAIRVINARAERAIEQLVAAGAAFDAVVLDPPRSGAAGCIGSLLRLAPRRLVYVACDPATLARDLAALRTRYDIDAVQPVDMFPHTYHIETVVRATLSCQSGTPGVSSARRHESAEPSRRRRTRRRTS
jgi:23S rRNA (uracil1939-C5)-methyltransferase